MTPPADRGRQNDSDEPGADAPGSRAFRRRRDPPDDPALPERHGPPLLSLTIWPNRSLSRRGLRNFLLLLGLCLAMPLLPLIGTAAAWGLLPFLLAVPLAVYVAIRRNNADGQLVEVLRLWPDLITVERREPRGRVRRWHADPHWVQIRLFDNARIEKYLTLRGNGREIELGAFLSPEERQALYAELRDALAGIAAPRPAPAAP